MRATIAVVLGMMIVSAGVCFAATPEHRAIWANYRDILTPEAVQSTVERVSNAHLNAIYILVWYNGGQAAYKSALGPMMQKVPDGFDPLGALIAAAHPRGIHVHAWFVNGAYGWVTGAGPVFTRHPDWQLNAGTGAQDRWYDLGKPEVRRFQRDVMLECLQRYDLDGIHFDYIRFSGRGMCYCDYCQGEVQKRYGIPPLSSSNPTFPLAAQLSGNPLGKPTTAQVLAVFEDGVPAITLNKLGQGEAVLVNWQATRGGNLAVRAFAGQVLQRFGVAAGTAVYQLRNSQTTARYGLAAQNEGAQWLRDLGCQPKAIDETKLSTVPAGTTVVLQGQYLLTTATAEWLEGFITAGGHALVVDGPVFAIKEPALQRALGLAGTAKYFSDLRVITPAPGQDLIKAGPPIDIEVEKRRAAAWVEFWTSSVTDLVRQVYQGAKAAKPTAWVSAAVFQDKKAADSVCQDWYGWLREGIIDYVLPMAYTMDTKALKAQLDEWQAFDPAMARIIPGLSIYAQQGGQAAPRDLRLTKEQQDLCRTYRVHGNCYFALDYLTPALQAAFATGPYAEAATPYYPARQ